ncbi:beta strand repeat-containing protein [Paraburkholderia youngii]|uniref:beta strand repeat-containing protein n=1 Tax=Paraburkholderia youngii TaxID=2782701 RepID=UPI003D232081
MAAAQYYEEVQQAYLAYYGRPADPEGREYWAVRLDNAGGDLNSIINAFGNSNESTALYGGSNTAAQIAAIYQTLFGRQPDAEGLNFYQRGIINGDFTLASVALNIYYGATGDDKAQLDAKLAYAEAFTDAVSESVSAQIAYSGKTATDNARAAVAAVTDTTSEGTAAANLETTLSNINAGAVGQTVALTTGVDTLVGANGNNVFNAVLGTSGFGVSAATLNSFDSVTGGSGTNTLNISDASSILGHDVIPSGVTLSNIQNINLVTTGNAGTIGGQAFDVSGVSGLQNVTVVSGNVAGDNIKAATTVNVADTTGGAATVTGGNAVTVTANVAGGAGNVNITGAAGAVTVTDKGDAGSITVQGGTTVNVTGSAASGAVNIGTNGATTPTLNAAGTALSSATLAATPTGNVTVNESTTTDGVTTFSTSAATIYTNGATSVSLTGTKDSAITDIQTTVANGKAVGTSTLASVTVDGVSNSVVVTSDALTSLTILDSDLSLNALTGVTINNTNAHALALTVGANLVTGEGTNAPTKEFAYVGDSTATSISVATTGGVAANVNLNAAAATSLKFNNAVAVTLDSKSTLSDLKSITATGSGALDLTQATAKIATVTTIDASAATGSVKANITGAQVYEGGAGGDIVTLTSSLTSKSGGAISFGSGNDTLLASSGVSIGAGVTVDGGAGVNTISASLLANSVAATIKDFQIADVSGYNNGTLDTSLLATQISGLAISTASTTGSTLENLAAAVTVADAFDGDASALTLTHAAGTASNSVAINFADATTATFTAKTFSTFAAGDAGTVSLNVTSTGDSAVTVNSGGVKGVLNDLTLAETDNHLVKVTVTGANAFQLDGVTTAVNNASLPASGSTQSSLTTIDASATTGGVHIVAGANSGAVNDVVSYKGLAILGGTGGDIIVNGADNGSIVEGATAATTATHTAFNTLTVTGANATIDDSASHATDVINLSGFSDSVKLGSGGSATSAVSVTVADDTFGTAGAAKLGDTTTVTFGSGVATVNDGLHFNAASGTGDMLVLNGSTTNNSLAFTGVTIANAGALGSAVTLAAGTSGNLTFADLVTQGQSANAHTVTWFQFNGNTYIEESGAGATADAATGPTDTHLVKITGLVDLSHATISGNAIHFA